MKNDLVGRRIKNDGFSLRETLKAHYQLASLQYIGEYMFEAELVDGTFLRIVTLPTDESQSTLQIAKVTMIC